MKAVTRFIVMGCPGENSTGLSVCPASGQRALKGCDPPGGSTRCCEEHSGKEQKGGGAAFKVFVRSDICTAKCDIVAKVTACFLFGKSKGIPNIDRLPAFALFNLHNFLSFGRNFSGLPLETMFFPFRILHCSAGKANIAACF